MVLEKEHVISSTVSRYPKGKHFMAEPSDVDQPVVPAGVRRDEGGAGRRVEARGRGREAPDQARRGGRDGEARRRRRSSRSRPPSATYRARTVVLATGLRGKPRLLAVPGANLEKVQSLLDDPAEFGGQHVLVVGGGDSAVEAAMSLVDAGATRDAVVPRRRLQALQAGQPEAARRADRRSTQLAVLLESNVTGVHRRRRRRSS